MHAAEADKAHRSKTIAGTVDNAILVLCSGDTTSSKHQAEAMPQTTRMERTTHSALSSLASLPGGVNTRSRKELDAILFTKELTI